MNAPRWTSVVILAVLAVCAIGYWYINLGFNGVPISAPLATTTAAISSEPAATSSAKTALGAKQLAATTTKAGTKAAPVPQNSTPPVSSSVQQARNLSASGSQLLKSLVNIVCVSSDPSIPSISGSGVMIDSRGIILTAAHVAQLFLLQDYLGSNKVACLIRTGSPARRAYYAEPIYVSKSWVENNPSTLTTEDPKGTGQHDVALLAVTATATSTPLPTSFPYIPLANRDPQLNENMAIGSYGAQYLSATDLNYSLYPTLIFGSVEDRYTYAQTTVDVISLDGSAAAQEGSSGGGIATADGTLIGTITTSSITGPLTDRVLNAVTVDHLRRTYLLDTGADLDSTLANNSVSQLIANFKGEAQTLGAQLANSINVN